MYRPCSKILRLYALAVGRWRLYRFYKFYDAHREMDEMTAHSLFYIRHHGQRLTVNNLPTCYLNMWTAAPDLRSFEEYTNGLMRDFERVGLLGFCTPYAVMCYTRHRYWKYGAMKCTPRYRNFAFRYSNEIRASQEMNFYLLLELQQILWTIRDARANRVQLPNARLFDVDRYERINLRLRKTYETALAERGKIL